MMGQLQKEVQSNKFLDYKKKICNLRNKIYYKNINNKFK